MARPLRLHVPGMLAHVMSRGNNRKRIFIDETDYRRYVALLAAGTTRFHVRCPAYCLMPNHVHLLLRPAAFSVSRLMQHVNSTYCQWFNRRHARIGHVLQGRFKCLLVDDHIYHRRVVRYIVRNPVAAGRVRDPAKWRWSSYRASAGLEPSPSFLDVEDVWSMFDPQDVALAQQQFRAFAASTADDDLTGGPLLAGPPGFAAHLQPRLQDCANDEEFVYAERFAIRPALATILTETPANDIAFAAARAFYAYAYTLHEIGVCLGRPTATVWSWVHRAATALGPGCVERADAVDSERRLENRHLIPKREPNPQVGSGFDGD